MAIVNRYVDMTLESGDNDGTSWANAFRTAAAFETYLEGTLTTEHVVWIQNNVTLNDSWDFSARDGTAALPITFIGVKDGTSAESPAYSDWADGNMAGGDDERPQFILAGNLFKTGDFTKFFNIKFTSTYTYGVFTNYACTFYNCQLYNTSGSANQYAMYYGNSYVHCISCELKSTNGYAVNPVYGNFYFCYIHTSATGVLMSGNYATFAFCVFDDCTTGINLATYMGVQTLNCDFHNCTTAVLGSTGAASVNINNIIDNLTDGFKWTTVTNQNFFWNNHKGENVTDMWDGVNEADVPYMDNAVTGGAGEDPDFTDQVGHDFSLESTSPCIDAGLALTLGVG